MHLKMLVSSLGIVTMMCSSAVIAAEHKEATFIATITADIPNDFRILTKEGDQDTISLTFPDSSFNATDSIFRDQFKAVKIIGTAVNDNTSVDMSVDNLSLTSDDGKKVDMMVMFADDKGHEPTIDDVDLDTMVIADLATHVTLSKANIKTLSSFYIGYNLNGNFVVPGHYTGSITLTAAAEL